MFCPICKAEFREGFEDCTSCQVNLVEDLDNIVEEIIGEVKVCVACQIEFDSEDDRCSECSLKLIRAVLHEDTYVFLEPAPLAGDAKMQDTHPDLDLVGELEYYADIPESEAVVLIESQDLNLLIKVQEILNENHINFMFCPAQDDPSSLGSMFGDVTPLNRSFPQVLVYTKDEDKALELIASNTDLGLAEIPEELLESDDDEEYDDHS